MTKYYRVRSRQQWDWLMQWFENENKNIKWVNGSEKPSNSKIRDSIIENGVFVNVGLYIKLDVYNSISYGYDTEMHMHDYIEVSQMMEDEKMEDYVTIKGKDLLTIKDEKDRPVLNEYHNLDKGWDGYSLQGIGYIKYLKFPTASIYPKVRMSVAEKKEFDELKSDWQVLICAFDAINEIDYPRWFSRLNDYPDDNDKHQLDFARAWADESLIEVIPEKKWEVKVPCAPDHYYLKDTDNELIVSYASDGTESRKQFTSKELKHYGLDNDLFEKVEVSK